MKTLAIALLCALSVSSVQASVVVGGTRVIFDGQQKAATLSVQNKDKTANLVQSWISPVSTGSAAKDTMIITPPLFRLDAGEKASVRIVRSGKTLPEDRESMFWLNVKGIPAMDGTPAKNEVQIAINSRIKLIYRPISLRGNVPESAAGKLTWSTDGNAMKVNNPTPYYMNFSTVTVNNTPVKSATFVAPFSSADFSLPKAQQHGEVKWQIINDFGMRGNEHTANY
ncbi:fimbrial assembly chaperone [Cronobacter dublinensis]|uniref:fimbrial assembly chaperone n=1 Tax=Cronobacter dublinensis TaxID=413497 RepID=UPI001DC9714C|nr:fimbrial assembly chaperone [Cronobacter dublinensis]EGT4380391.1 fimbrial assembly protein [Cronobacter dublinensis]EKM6455636.1 fimbrial assembly chaperone [Cronobacter dublinensis]EKY3201549.1 fimbrial assembly chaperone [Cronobacter dublinensis]ELQ6158718.1 fimbrial assembly chaperone [Cronobacter dublinensis]ELY2818971.1 fimbrial assembly chaperone [Cronobacter dublinensis]